MSNIITDSTAIKPKRLRKWGIRFLKTLGVLAAIFALIHAEEYWRGNRAYARALADWKAAGLPTAEEFFKNGPDVPTEKNLLDAPFFSMWKKTNTEAQTNREPRIEKWYARLAIPFPANGNSFDTNWQRLFVSKDKRGPAIKSVPEKSDARVLIESLETDFPELKTIVASERDRTETSFDFKWPAPERIALEAPTPSYRNIRDGAFPLTLYAAAKLEEGDGAPALAVIRASLRTELALQECKNLVAAMIGCIHAKISPIPLTHEGLSHTAWNDDELRALDTLIGKYYPDLSLSSAMIGETLSFASAINALNQGGIIKVFAFIPRDELPPGTESFSYLIPRGWLKFNSAELLNHRRDILSNDTPTTGFNKLTHHRAADRRLAEASLSPYNILSKLATPAYVKVSANASQTQAKLNCCRLGIALERHRLKTGAFPEALDALTPGLIEKIPLGPVGGLAPVYVKNTDGGYTLTYKGEDFSEADLSSDNLVGKDIVWTMPAPKAR